MASGVHMEPDSPILIFYLLNKVTERENTGRQRTSLPAIQRVRRG